MVTTRGTERDLDATLAALIELDLDVAEAYKAAISGLQDPSLRIIVGGFLADHERHAVELSAFMRGRGSRPPARGDCRSVLAQGKVFIGRLRGDRGILGAMRSNERDVIEAYERANARTDLAPQLGHALLRALLDERRHHTWIERQLRGEGSE